VGQSANWQAIRNVRQTTICSMFLHNRTGQPNPYFAILVWDGPTHIVTPTLNTCQHKICIEECVKAI